MARSDLDCPPKTDASRAVARRAALDAPGWSQLMQSDATATVQVAELGPADGDEALRFHWNGFEAVFCSVSPTGWSGVHDRDVVVLFNAAAALDRVRATGTATSDHVAGVAPEFRAAMVRDLGAEAGHAACDALPDSTITHRLIVTISSFASMQRGSD